MKTSLYLTLCAAALFLAAGPALSAPETVLGQKVDSGLGGLPHYSKWADPTGRLPMGHRVLGESLDDGLGELLHYSKWVDSSGRDSLGRRAAQVAVAQR